MTEGKNIKIEVVNNCLEIQIDNHIFYDYLHNLDLIPNRPIYLEKLHEILKYTGDDYQFIENDQYVFKFKIDIFNETLEIKN